MFVQEKVEIKWNGVNKNHFINLGYCFTKMGDKFLVNIEDMMKNSEVSIEVQCDYCGEKYNIEYCKYKRDILDGIIKKCACEKCKKLKKKERNIIIYGIKLEKEKKDRKLEENFIKKELLKRGYILLSSYENNNTKMLFEDSEGYKYEMSWQGYCNSGKPPLVYVSNKYSMYNIKLFLIKNKIDLIPLDTKYTGTFDKITLVDNIGYKYISNWAYLQNKKHPRAFGRENPYTIDNIKLFLKLNDIDYEVMSKEYLNSSKKLILKCSKHGEFSISWGNLQSLKGCKECSKEKTKGKNHYNYKGGITSLENYLRRRLDYWKREVLKLNNYTCDVSGIRGGILEIHHIYSFSDILKDTLSELNLDIRSSVSKYSKYELESIESKFKEFHHCNLGVCLQADIHKEFHAIYGKGNNTKDQYIQFKNEYIEKLNDKKVS